MHFLFRKFDLFLLAVEPVRGYKSSVTLRDDVHNFIDVCRKELDAGKDLYNVMIEYGAKAQAREAVSHEYFPALHPVGC